MDFLLNLCLFDFWSRNYQSLHQHLFFCELRHQTIIHFQLTERHRLERLASFRLEAPTVPIMVLGMHKPHLMWFSTTVLHVAVSYNAVPDVMNRAEPFSTVVVCVETQLPPKDGGGGVQHQLLIWLRFGTPDVYK